MGWYFEEYEYGRLPKNSEETDACNWNRNETRCYDRSRKHVDYGRHYMCTRKTGHLGKHVSGHINRNQIYAIWYEDDGPPAINTKRRRYRPSDADLRYAGFDPNKPLDWKHIFPDDSDDDDDDYE